MIPLIFPKVPQSSIRILRVPQLPPPLKHPPLRTLQMQVIIPYYLGQISIATAAGNRNYPEKWWWFRKGLLFPKCPKQVRFRNYIRPRSLTVRPWKDNHFKLILWQGKKKMRIEQSYQMSCQKKWQINIIQFLFLPLEDLRFHPSRFFENNISNDSWLGGVQLITDKVGMFFFWELWRNHRQGW